MKFLLGRGSTTADSDNLVVLARQLIQHICENSHDPPLRCRLLLAAGFRSLTFSMITAIVEILTENAVF